MNTRMFSTVLICATFFALPAAATVRPEIANDLKRAVRLAGDSHFPRAEQQIKIAEETPNLTNEEKLAVDKTKAKIAAGIKSRGADCDLCRMEPNGDNWGSQ